MEATLVLGYFISAEQVPGKSAELLLPSSWFVSLMLHRLEIHSRDAHWHEPCETHCHTLRAQGINVSTWTVPQQFLLTCLGGSCLVCMSL